MFNKKPKPDRTNVARKRANRLDDSRPSTFRYYAKRSDGGITTGRQSLRIETAQQARAASRYWQERFGMGALLISAIFCLVYVSTLSGDPRIIISDAVPAKTVLQDPSIYRNAASDSMKRSVFNRNKVTVDASKISRELERNFPEIADVQASLPLLTHRLTFTVVSAQPTVLLATANGSFALDTNGTALLTGSQLSGLSKLDLPLVNDESNLKVQLRKQALTSDNVTFILTVVSQLKAKGFTINSMTLPATASELDVRLAGEPYYIKFNLASKSARQQAGTFIAVNEKLKSQSVVPSEYIDVRLDGRAYYK